MAHFTSLRTLAPAAMICLLSACGNPESTETTTTKDTATAAPATMRTETVDIQQDSITLKNFVAYPASTSPAPIVLVIPEWWGLNDYAKMRAEQLASLGYLAMAVDMYGDGFVASNPDEAGKKAGAFYGDSKLGMSRITAALNKAKTLQGADAERTAIVGYCFGGSMGLNAVRQGLPMDAIVSLHGNLKGVPPSKDAMQNVDVLIIHGGADKFVSKEEVAGFKKEMDSIGKAYTFKEYEGATHAFTNPNATETGKKFSMPIEYNGAADTASWEEMKGFLQRSFSK